MHDRLFAIQDSIGVRSWGRFSADVAIADTSAFVACVRSEQQPGRLVGALSEQEFERQIRELLQKTNEHAMVERCAAMPCGHLRSPLFPQTG